MVGMLCSSKAGHDKNKIYIIIEEKDEAVLLVDGEYKLTDKPKLKSKKHIQLIKKSYDNVLCEKIKKKDTYSNEEIKRAIKLYRATLRQEENICQNLM